MPGEIAAVSSDRCHTVAGGVLIDRWQEDAHGNRIEARHHASDFLTNHSDLWWMFADLMIRTEAKDSWNIDYDLSRLSVDSGIGLLPGQRHGLMKPASFYIDNPKYHCTVLRDFLLVGITEQILDPLKKPSPRPVGGFRRRFRLVMLAMSAVLLLFVSWWSAALTAAVLLLIEGPRLVSKDKALLRHFIFQAAENLRDRLRDGGFDEMTLIREFEMIDIRYGAGARASLLANGMTVPLAEIRPVPIPDLQYTLLRLPRRNVAAEVINAYREIDDPRKAEMVQRLRQLTDALRHYDEPPSANQIPR